MSRLNRAPTCKPRVVKTDYWHIYIYPVDGIVKFYKPRIHLGEIVKSKTPKLVLKVAEFDNYKQDFATLVEYLRDFGERL